MSQTTQGYSGYYQREVPAEDPELTHVGPGTACGEYLRRYWQPVAMSEEVGDLPVAVRILAEDRWCSAMAMAVWVCCIVTAHTAVRRWSSASLWTVA